MTFICVSIMVEEIAAALADAQAAKGAGARLVEWRVDRVADDIDLVERLVRDSPLPCIVTCRPVSEGGEYDGDDQQRVSLFEHVGLHARPRYLDVELAAFDRSANLRQKIKLAIRHPDQWRAMDTGLILSTHDVSGRPRDLYQRVERMTREEACEVIKIAWTARSLRDNLEAFELLRSRHRPTVALCMGRFGLMSRVLAPKFRALLTFASLREESATAPGQPTIDALRRRYRFDAVKPTTRVYGLVGWPVEHSRSPRFHNAGFEAVGFDGVYLPLPVHPDDAAFKATVGALARDPHLDFRGASVTLPHKERLLRFVRDEGGGVDEWAADAGAANTLIVRDDGTLEARNSDALALVECVAEALGRPISAEIAATDSTPGSEWRDLRVAVIGAGGMARAAIAAFSRHGAAVVVHNRTHEKAERLAGEFAAKTTDAGERRRVVAARLEKVCASCCHVVIHATPVGLAGGPDPDGLPFPIDAAPDGRAIAWTPQTLVVDTVYTPPLTPLLRFARQRGTRTLSGLDIFLRQATLQFEWWTGHRPSPEQAQAWSNE